MTVDGDTPRSPGVVPAPRIGHLRRNGLVQTSWRESTSGPPRRYYHLTSDGELALASFKKQWRVFRDAVDEILSEGSQQ